MGIEANVNYQIISGLNLYGNATFQDAQFTKFEGNDDLVGNQPRRQPSFMGMVGITFEKNGFDIDLSKQTTNGQITSNIN